MTLVKAKFGDLTVWNSGPLMKPHAHGRHRKDLVVLHETVSANIVHSLADVESVENYLAGKDYGIHGVTDNDRNIAWAVGMGDAIFWQCGGVNERSIGVEQVSDVMVEVKTNKARLALWHSKLMSEELDATAMLLAQIHKSWGIPLRYSDGDHPGVTTHWSVSQHHPESEGHTDCWPVHLGGYYPALEVISRAKGYAIA